MYNTNNLFCLIDGGIIYQVDTYNKNPIGYTTESYRALEATTQEYYDKLVELGVIVPPKTQEQINAELQKALIDSQNMNMQLMEMMKEIKGGMKNESAANGKNQSDVPKQQPVRKGNGSPKPSESGAAVGADSKRASE